MQRRRDTHGLLATVAGLLALLLGCRGGTSPCEHCDTVVIAATGEPSVLLPPLVRESVGRDIGDLVFERLAVLRAGGSPGDPGAYAPGLASRWERTDSLTWRFHLRPKAAWHDGKDVTADDVRFSFEAYTDSVLDTGARSALAGEVRAEAENDSTVLIRFRRPRSEQLYDATWHVRILPRHLWDSVPRNRWEADSSLARLTGSGRFRVTSWSRGQSLTLERAAPDPAAIRRVVWRFTGDQDAALNLVLSHEADLLETVTTPAARARVDADSSLRPIAYPAAVHGFLGFRLSAQDGRRHPVLGDPAVRRALVTALDRAAMVRAVFGPDARVPPGPMSRALWIWDDSIRTLPYDTAVAAARLDSAGWRRSGSAGQRRRGGQALGLDILVPSTSGSRRQLAVAAQEMWRRMGIKATVSAVDFPVFQERLARGRFDAFIGAWLDEPSPRSLADQWTAAGIGSLNYSRYASPAFDQLFARALGADPAAGRRLWREAMDTLNADAPAAFLYTPTNVAVVARRLEGVEINPFSWLAGLPNWTVSGKR